MEGNFPSSCSPPPSEKRKCLPRFSSSSFFISAIASAMCVRILGRMDVKCVNCFLSWYFLSFAVDYEQHPAQKKQQENVCEFARVSCDEVNMGVG